MRSVPLIVLFLALACIKEAAAKESQSAAKETLAEPTKKPLVETEPSASARRDAPKRNTKTRAPTTAKVTADSPPAYQRLLEALNREEIRRDYAGVVRKLEQGDANERQQAVKTLGATGELAAIPWLIDTIDDSDRMVASWAVASLSKLISGWALARRDRTQPSKVVINPLPDGELDLAPLAWLVESRLGDCNDSGSGHWATMAGYLDLEELQPALRHCLQSRHPASVNSAKAALALLAR